MARLVEAAGAAQRSARQVAAYVLDADAQPPGEQVFLEEPDGSARPTSATLCGFPQRLPRVTEAPPAGIR